MMLQNKVALITGGARGIGKAIARRFAREGAVVTIVNTNPETAKIALSEINGDGRTAASVVVNVADGEAVNEMVKSVLAIHGKIDILVNNAGITRDNLLVRMKTEEWDEVMRVNLTGTFNCIRAVSRPMMKARYGKIINISSVVGVIGNPGQANYAASKAGIIALTKTAAKELASRNINVNTVSPGYIVTDMTGNLKADATNAFLANVPLGRPGLPEDVANMVCFLASEEAAYVTGQTIHVDGGMVM